MKRWIGIVTCSVAVAALAAILTGCPEPSGPGWQALFTDAFTRANTTGLDLGSANWAILQEGSTTSTMAIASNQVASHFSDGTIGIVAEYQGTVDYADRLLVSVKLKVSSTNEVPYTVGGLTMNLDPEASYRSYTAQVESGRLFVYEFDGADYTGTEEAAYTLANDTWYTLEMESDGLVITARLKSAAGTVLATVTYTETGSRTYSDGTVGFFDFTTSDGSSPVDQPVYFDDFSVSVFE